MALERELELFARELPNLLADSANHGKYVLIGGDPLSVAGVYDTVFLGLEAGYEKFGLAAFLVKQIVEREEPRYFSRSIICRT